MCKLQWQIRMEEYFFVKLIIRILTEMNYWIQSQWNVHCHTYLDKRKNVTDVQHVFSLSGCLVCLHVLLFILTSHKKKAEWLACAGWMQMQCTLSNSVYCILSLLVYSMLPRNVIQLLYMWSLCVNQKFISYTKIHWSVCTIPLKYKSNVKNAFLTLWRIHLTSKLWDHGNMKLFFDI